VQTYNPAKVVLTFLGQIVTGFAEGSFLKASRNKDTYTYTAGADGSGCRTLNPDKSGRVTITLMQSSISNDVLSAAQILDELTGSATGPLIVKDLNGSLVVSAGNAWIVKPADVDLAAEVGNREWVIEAKEMTIAGGSIL
jgi:Protein of unknown function (DUF3277)